MVVAECSDYVLNVVALSSSASCLSHGMASAITVQLQYSMYTIQYSTIGSDALQVMFWC